MSASMRGAVCYAILFICPILYATNDPTLNDVLTALEKMVSFYKLTHREMNLDGIYGLRVLEGQILLLLMEYEKGRHQHLPLSVVARLHMLHQRARNVSERSLPFLASQDRAYYNKLRPLVEKPFMVAHEYRRVDLTLRWIQTEKQRREVPFDEEFSDRCMGELMGTGRSDGRTCIMTPQCLGAMFIRGLGEYQITHQLLYMMLAEQEGCVGQLNDWLQAHGWSGGLSQRYLEFCSNNLLEMQRQMLALDGAIIPIYQDLFMEQQFVCPVLGFMEFLHADWLRQILSWQKPNGCFGRMPETDFARNYKDRHHLDYQYEGDGGPPGEGGEGPGGGPKPPPQAGRADGGRYRGHGVGTSTKEGYVDGQSAVIQQSNKLQLVVAAGNNHSLSSSIRKDNVDSQKAQPRQVPKRPAGGTEVERHISQNINDNANSDSRGRKQRQENLINQNLNTQRQSTYRNHNVPGTDTQQRTYTDTKRGARKKRRTPQKSDFEVPARGASGKNVHPVGEERPVLRKLDIPVQEDGVTDDQHQAREFMIRRLHALKDRPEQPHVGGMRRLLLERALTASCLSHKTAVAAGALSQYLRLLVYPGSPEYQSHVRLGGPNVILNPGLLFRPRPDPAAPSSRDHKGGILLHKAPKAGRAAGGARAGGKGAAQKRVVRMEQVPLKTNSKNPRVILNPMGQRGAGGGYRSVNGHHQGEEEEHVVPRPHPDDMIHSEVIENQGDEDNHPQDYYDPDDDRDDPDNYDPEPRNVAAADLPKLSLNHHRFRHDTLVEDPFDGRRGDGINKGDEEYEQYVDDDDDPRDQEDGGRRVVQKLDLLTPRRVGDRGVAPRRVVINVPAGETAREANHDEDTYSYYDKDDTAEVAPRAAHRRVKLAAPHVHYAKRHPPLQKRRADHTSAAGAAPVGEKKLPHPGVSPPGRIYMVLFGIMLVLLVFMYRFVKKRRIVIRYPRNGFR